MKEFLNKILYKIRLYWPKRKHSKLILEAQADKGNWKKTKHENKSTNQWYYRWNNYEIYVKYNEVMAVWDYVYASKIFLWPFLVESKIDWVILISSYRKK